MDGTDIISQLVKKPFGPRKFEEKRLIVKNGRPCPPLKGMTTAAKEIKKSYMRHFSVSYYESYSWLCGSESTLKLFCWPCLLFAKSSNSIWVGKGFDNLNGFTKSAKTHGKSEIHLQCVLHLYRFGLQSLDETPKENNTLHNEKVQKNREIFKRFIDVTCFLAKLQLPFEGHNEDEESLNEGNYIETLNLLKTWDPLLMEHFDDASVSELTSSDNQKILISCISDVVKEAIKHEIEETNFVAIMLDEISDVEIGSKLSTVLRYVCKGEICVKERFIGFTDVSADCKADALFSHVNNIVEEFQLKDKLIAQSYDGAVLRSGQLSRLPKMVLQDYPQALHTYCYAHELNLVLVQGLNEIPECFTFFSTLNGIATFSSQAVEEHLKKSFPSFSPTRYSFTSHLIDTFENYWKSIVDFLGNVSENNDEGNWTGQDKCTAHGYFEYLNDFQTVFLMNLFSPLFLQSNMLFQILQSKKANFMEFVKDVRNFLQLLNNFKKGFIHCTDCKNKLPEDNPCENCETVGFEPLWDKIISMMGLPISARKRRKQDESDIKPKQNYRNLYYTIIDNLVCHIESRFSSVQKLAFFELLDPRKCKFFSTRHNFPEFLLNVLGNIYPGTFDLIGLKNELSALYSSNIIEGKSPQGLIKFLVDEGLNQSFEEIFQLAKLISTIPATIASVEKNFSALERIQSYIRSTKKDDGMDNLSILSIEQEMLEKLRKKEDFYNIISEKFATKTQRSDYMYK